MRAVMPHAVPNISASSSAPQCRTLVSIWASLIADRLMRDQKLNLERSPARSLIYGPRAHVLHIGGTPLHHTKVWSSEWPSTLDTATKPARSAASTATL